MEILRSISDLGKVQGPVVLVAGTFDGLHLGHQGLIQRALVEAEQLGGKAVVMTFDPHPSSLIHSKVSDAQQY